MLSGKRYTLRLVSMRYTFQLMSNKASTTHDFDIFQHSACIVTNDIPSR